MHKNSEKKVVLLSERTSMRVGGPCHEFYEPSDEKGFVDRVNGLYQAEKPYFVIGNGTNVIVRDGGYEGAVISTLCALSGVEIHDDVNIVCGAGESLAVICRFAANSGLSGLEEISGIPGTVGGAVYMNAGAYDSEIANTLISVSAYDPETGKHIMLTNNECGFGYRESVFKTKPLLILSAVLGLERGDSSEIKAKMADYTKIRNEKQPVDMPSAGSYFKRPVGEYAGRLIEAAGMKGARAGGAQVSEKHAGFIVNTGGATASDIIGLAEKVKACVFEKFGVLLEEEPVIIGVDSIGTN